MLFRSPKNLDPEERAKLDDDIDRLLAGLKETDPDRGVEST